MGYIMNLRKYVGHQPIMMTTACVLVANDKKHVLLQRRADNGFLGYPGGVMELGESFEECARRAVLEETEALEQRFFDLDNLPENISPIQKEVLFMLVDKMMGQM